VHVGGGPGHPASGVRGYPEGTVRHLRQVRPGMLLDMNGRPRSLPRALMLIGGIALLLSACSSDHPIHVITETSLGGTIIPTNLLCNVSGATTTTTGSSTGPENVVLALTVRNAASQIVGTSPTVTRRVPSGHTWNWTLRARTGASVPTECIVNTVGSTRPSTIP